MKIRILFFLLSLYSYKSLALLEDLNQLETKYPIVLIHGMLGFSVLCFYIEYWGNLPFHLEMNGAKVYCAELSQAHDIETRGEQLILQLKSWGHKKYNLIGHSQGGLDARHVHAKVPELIASVLTICTPHHGSKIADLVYNAIESLPLGSSLLWKAGNLASHTIGLLSGNIHQQDFKKAINSLTTHGLEKFNAKYPKGITENNFDEDKLYSMGIYNVEPNGKYDMIGILMKLSGYLFYGKQENDGVVAKYSMQFGLYMEELKGAHHLIPTGHLGNYPDVITSQFLHSILNHVQALKKKEL
jgi:triacylglycerol lipase